MSSRPQQRKAAAKAENALVAWAVPDRNKRPRAPQAQVPADPQPPVEAPKEPAVLQKKRKVAHLTQLAQVAPLDAQRVRVKKESRVKRVKIQQNRSTGGPGV